jgi:hypothetical protein
VAQTNINAVDIANIGDDEDYGECYDDQEDGNEECNDELSDEELELHDGHHGVQVGDDDEGYGDTDDEFDDISF